MPGQRQSFDERQAYARRIGVVLPVEQQAALVAAGVLVADGQVGDLIAKVDNHHDDAGLGGLAKVGCEDVVGRHELHLVRTDLGRVRHALGLGL